MRLALLATIALTACSAQPEDTQTLTHQDGNAEDADERLERARAEQEEAHRQAVEEASSRKALILTEVYIDPEEPLAADALEATAQLMAGHSPFAEVDFTWHVNGRSLLGVTSDTLRPTKGRYKKGDVIKVVATATDEKGTEVSMTSDEVVIQNSIPEIVTDIRGQSGLNGLRLKAIDPDNDKLRWSIVEGPRGVTINSSGTLRVDVRDLKEAYNGEVVIAAEDPEGARAELHIPVNINAATEGTRQEEKVTKRRGRNDGTEEDYAKAQERAVESIGDMNDDEFKAYMDKQEKNADR